MEPVRVRRAPAFEFFLAVFAVKPVVLFLTKVKNQKKLNSHLHWQAHFDKFLTSKASLAQLVERHLAKVVVEGSTPLARSILFSMGV